MTIHDLITFNTVAIEKSFVNAAKKLYISQSAVSQQIKKLENELGFQLFLRDRHSVSLTEQGEILHKAALEIVSKYNLAIAECTKNLNNDKTFSIAGIGQIRNTLIPIIMQGFMVKHPQSRININAINPFQIIQSLIDGQNQMVITPYYLIDKDIQISFIPLYEDSHYCVMNKKNPLASRKKVTYEDICPFVLLTPSSNRRPPHMQLAIDQMKSSSRKYRFEDGFTADNATSHLLYSPDMIAIMPGYTCPKHPDLVIVLLENNIKIRVGIAYTKVLTSEEKEFTVIAQRICANIKHIFA